jgi:hypothetical protein
MLISVCFDLKPAFQEETFSDCTKVLAQNFEKMEKQSSLRALLFLLLLNGVFGLGNSRSFQLSSAGGQFFGNANPSLSVFFNMTVADLSIDVDVLDFHLEFFGIFLF